MRVRAMSGRTSRKNRAMARTDRGAFTHCGRTGALEREIQWLKVRCSGSSGFQSRSSSDYGFSAFSINKLMLLPEATTWLLADESGRLEAFANWVPHTFERP